MRTPTTPVQHTRTTFSLNGLKRLVKSQVKVTEATVVYLLRKDGERIELEAGDTLVVSAKPYDKSKGPGPEVIR